MATMEAVLREENERLTDENRRLQSANSRLSASLEEKAKRVPLLEGQIEQLQAKLGEALAQLDQERRNSYSGVAIMNAREAKYTQLQKEYTELTASLKAVQGSHQADRSALELERRHANQLQSKIDDLEDDLDAERSARVSREAEADGLRGTKETLEAALSNERGANERLREELAACRATVRQVERELSSATSLREAAEALLSTEREDHANALAQVEEEMTRQRDAGVAAAVSEHDRDAHKWQRTEQRLREQLGQLEKAAEAEEAALRADIDSGHKSVRRVSKQLEAMRERQQAAMQEALELRLALQTQRDIAEATRIERDSARDHQAKVEKECEQLKEQLAALDERVGSGEMALHSEKDRAARAEASTARAKEEAATRIRELESQMESLRAQARDAIRKAESEAREKDVAREFHEREREREREAAEREREMALMVERDREREKQRELERQILEERERARVKIAELESLTERTREAMRQREVAEARQQAEAENAIKAAEAEARDLRERRERALEKEQRRERERERERLDELRKKLDAEKGKAKRREEHHRRRAKQRAKLAAKNGVAAAEEAKVKVPGLPPGAMPVAGDPRKVSYVDPSTGTPAMAQAMTSLLPDGTLGTAWVPFAGGTVAQTPLPATAFMATPVPQITFPPPPPGGYPSALGAAGGAAAAASGAGAGTYGHSDSRVRVESTPAGHRVHVMPGGRSADDGGGSDRYRDRDDRDPRHHDRDRFGDDDPHGAAARAGRRYEDTLRHERERGSGEAEARLITSVSPRSTSPAETPIAVQRSTTGDLIATCRRQHCLRRFNVNDNASLNSCGFHPVAPEVSFDGEYYPCCGSFIRPGAPNVYCQFRPHLA